METADEAYSNYKTQAISLFLENLLFDSKEMPKVSIIIPVWKNHLMLEDSFRYLSAQVFDDFEIVIVDNGSNENTLNELLKHWQNLDIFIKRFDKNKGYAVANNAGASLARGMWLVLLNDDAFPQPDWLEKLIETANKNSEYSFFASCQVQYNSPELLDGAGDAYHITGLAWRRLYNRPVQLFRQEGGEIFSVCPAAAMYSREEFLKVGGFDEDYFSYFEDVDLGFRLRLSGAKCLYVPEAVVRHVGSASTGKRSDFSVYYGYRNMIWTFVKNMPSPYFWIFLPLHIITLFFFFVYLTMRGQGRAISRAIWDALHGLPKALAKRKIIQRDVKIKPQDLLKVMSTGLLEPYREFINRNRSK